MAPVSSTSQANSLPTEPSGNPYSREDLFSYGTRVLQPIARKSQATDTTWWQRKVPLLLQENWQLMLKRSELLDGFLGRVFKGNVWGEGCSSWTFFSLVTGEITG